MKTYLFTTCLSLFLFLGFSTTIFATEVAGGQMVIVNVDDIDPCDNKDDVVVVATLLKQCGPNVPDVNPDIIITFTPIDPKCGTQFTKKASLWEGELNGVDYIEYSGTNQQADNPCVVTTKDCKNEVYHYKTDIITLDSCQWLVSWEETFRPLTSQNLIQPDLNALRIENEYFTDKPCFDKTTGPTDFPPNTRCVFNKENNSPVFIDPVPMAEFCVGKEYNYYIGATDPDGDILEYELTSARGENGTPIGSIPGYTYLNPFRSSNGITLDKENGILTFKPNMIAEATVVVKINEYRENCLYDETTGYLTTERVLVGSTIRDIRFIIEDECNTETVDFMNYRPSLLDKTPTPEEIIPNLLEYDCGVMIMPIKLSYPIQCSSMDPYGTDFRLVSGDVNNPDKLYAIDRAIVDPKFPCQGDTTKNIILYLYSPISTGNYKLFLKMGDDFNTLRTKCGVELDAYTTVDVLINAKADNVEFDVEDLAACRPEGEPPVAKYGIEGDFYTWRYEGTPVDDGQPGMLDSSQTWTVDSAGEWTVTIDRVGCVYTDTFEVTIYNNIPLPEIPDFDLCISEEWPLIDHVKDYLKSLEAAGSTVENHKWTLYSPANPKGEVIGYLDTLQTVVPGTYIFSVDVDLCTLTEEFIVKRRNDLNVDIGEDILKCQGDGPDTLISKEDFQKITKDFLYKWYKDDIEIPDSTGRSLVVQESGEYVLEVYKPIPNDPTNSYCVGTDTVTVTVVDTLIQPVPHCASISYYEGQHFTWPAVPHAESYEVIEVRQSGETTWIPAVDGDSINSHQTEYNVLQLLVRAVNDEVDESYWCKYSPVNYTEQCEVVIKSPNVFTPNGDGINDVLMFNLLEIFPGSSLQIYNRWGRLVYESMDYKNDWDGGDLEAGTYFYILNINHEDHDLQKGTITLLR